MGQLLSKVYVLTDEQNRITRCEGGYSESNISNVDEWVLIDECGGDRGNLCQSHYFAGGLYTDDGMPRYKLVDGVPMLRTDDELQADREAQPPAEVKPTLEDRVGTLEMDSAETREALEMILAGVTE